MNTDLLHKERRANRILSAVLAAALIILAGCAQAAQQTKTSQTDGPYPRTGVQKTAFPYNDQYDLVHVSDVLSNQTMVGLADKNGEIVFDLIYSGIGITEKGHFILNLKGYHLIISPDGNEIGRYRGLEFYQQDADGNGIHYDAADYRNQPAAPYLAVDYDRGRICRLLDEDFNPVGDTYEWMALTQTGATAVKNSTFYQLDQNGAVLSKKEPAVVKTFFGKYQLHRSYDAYENGSITYGLFDENGKVIYDQAYSMIEMPFEDRVLLFTGNYQNEAERAVILGDTEGYDIGDRYNTISFIAGGNGYIGIARSFGPHFKAENTYYKAGCWLIDRDGNRISDKYLQIGNAVGKDGELYVNAEDTTSPLIFENEDGTIKTVPLSEVLNQMVINMGIESYGRVSGTPEIDGD